LAISYGLIDIICLT